MSGPIVDSPCGKLEGIYEFSSCENYQFCSFKGIPYAKPPVGELRFCDPVPIERWYDVRKATKFGPKCAHIDFITRSFVGCDDCLYLNIYVKSLNPSDRSSLLPVMFFIHGGGFNRGSSDSELYGPDYLLRKDVVLVTINYRLGVLGFLNLEDEIAPGNQGLKDQVLALQWVKKNIASFGGDPDNITIFGESAGASSVHYLCLSSLSRGLFHKAIMQSGVAINPWASMPRDPRRKVYQLCANLGNKTKDHKEIVKFLRTVRCERLAKASGRILTLDEKLKFMFPFGPAIDDKAAIPFMPKPLKMIVENGIHVPVLIGYNNREGLYVYASLEDEAFEKINTNFEKYMHPATKDIIQDLNLTGEDVKALYYGAEGITPSNRYKHADYLGDEHIVYGAQKVIRIQTERSSAPTYFYKFSYDKGISLVKSMLNIELEGVCHADELIYLFKPYIIQTLGIAGIQKGTMSYRIMEQVTEMWTNFAKYGRPTINISDLIPVHWQPVADGTVLRYLNIQENLRMEKEINIEEKFSFKKHLKNKL